MALISSLPVETRDSTLYQISAKLHNLPFAILNFTSADPQYTKFHFQGDHATNGCVIDDATNCHGLSGHQQAHRSPSSVYRPIYTKFGLERTYPSRPRSAEYFRFSICCSSRKEGNQTETVVKNRGHLFKFSPL